MRHQCVVGRRKKCRTRIFRLFEKNCWSKSPKITKKTENDTVRR